MRNRRYLFVLCAVVVAFSAACLARTHEKIVILVGLIALLGLIMMMLSVLCGILNLMFARKWPQDCTQAALVGIMMVSFFALMSLFLNIFWHMDDDVVLAYPEKAVPLLEQYRLSHGRYPATLQEAPSMPPLPPGLTYYGSEKDFTFFRYYGGFFSGCSYSKEKPIWKWTDD